MKKANIEVFSQTELADLNTLTFYQNSYWLKTFWPRVSSDEVESVFKNQSCSSDILNLMQLRHSNFEKSVLVARFHFEDLVHFSIPDSTSRFTRYVRLYDLKTLVGDEYIESSILDSYAIWKIRENE